MSKIKTEVTNKDAGATLAELNAKAAAELAGTPAEVKVEVKAAPVQPDIQALFEQSQQAADASEQAAKDRAELKAKLRTTDVSMDNRKGTIRESAELIAAVKADADKRGKNFSICPISGVLIVG